MNMELSTIDHEANIHISYNKPQQGFEFFGLLISIIYLLYSIKQELSQKKRKEKKSTTIFLSLCLGLREESTHWVHLQ